MIQHPSAFIDHTDVSIIRNKASKAEQTGMLHNEQLEVIYKRNWFKLLVPKTYNGLQATLPNLVRLQEAISWTDGSAGWVVTLCSGAGWFGGFIRPQIAGEIFNTPKVCLAGSGAVGGIAEMIPGGYIINGTWKYASGLHHATHITANCSIRKGGQPVLDESGELLVLPFIFEKKDVSLLSAWKYIGMVATGSDAFEIKNLEVTADRQFKINPLAAMIDHPLYQYPFLQLAEATLAVNLSGMAIHFLDLCEDIFAEKIKIPKLTEAQRSFIIDELKAAKDETDRVRSIFFEAVDQSWQSIITDKEIPEEQLIRVSTGSRQLARLAREWVDRLYPLCGLAAASTETEINRVWRDLHTASQHSLLTFASG